MSLLEKDNRKFSVIIGSKKCGACSGASPSGAARKIKGKRSEFYLKETTKGSKKKLYGPYSSKKKVVQRGGLRAELCQNLINFFLECPSFKDKKIDDGYKSIENAFKLLGISYYDPNRYIKLKSLIFLRTKYDRAIPFCQLLCQELPELQNYINEIDFIINFNLSFPKNSNIFMEHFSILNWANFIQYFNHQLKKMEIRNRLCLSALSVLNNCDRNSYPVHFRDLLRNVYIKLKIFNKEKNCNILKNILNLREKFKLTGQTPNLLDVLFNITENLLTETMFIENNFQEIKKLSSFISKQELTNMWNDVIKYIRKLIDIQVKESIGNIKDDRMSFPKELMNILTDIETGTKNKQRQNQVNLNKMSQELKEAKASFARNNLKELNRGNSEIPPLFLLSSRRNNGGNSEIPQTLLMSTINNNGNRGFAQAGPAAKEQNSNNEKIKLRQMLKNGKSSGPANEEIKFNPLNNPLLEITHRGRRNVKPTQPPHNNQILPASTNNLPPASRNNLIAKLQAALNNNE